MKFDFTYLITIASLIGTIANIHKKRWCFAVWIVTNTAWFVVDFFAGLYAQSLLFAIYTLLAICGLTKWK